MEDQSPLVQLYGVADAVFQRQSFEPNLDPEQQVLLDRWLPLNARPAGQGWYNDAVALFSENDSGFIPPEDFDNLVVTAHAALTVIENADDEPLLPANRRLHALTAVMRALPEQFEVNGELRPSAQNIMAQLGFDDQAIDLYRNGPEAAPPVTGDDVEPIGHLDEWQLLLDEAGPHRNAEAPDSLQNSPCDDRWVDSVVDGDVRPVVVLETDYDVLGTDLAAVCTSFLDPSHWPTCYGSVWKEMELCPAGQTGDLTAGGVFTYREIVEVGVFEIGTCLQFELIEAKYPDRCILMYELCDPAVDDGCWPQGKAKVQVDSGQIEVTALEDGTGVHISTSKSLRFADPMNGVGTAMLACAAGYGPQGKDMAESCSTKVIMPSPGSPVTGHDGGTPADTERPPTDSISSTSSAVGGAGALAHRIGPRSLVGMRARHRPRPQRPQPQHTNTEVAQ